MRRVWFLYPDPDLHERIAAAYLAYRKQELQHGREPLSRSKWLCDIVEVALEAM